MKFKTRLVRFNWDSYISLIWSMESFVYKKSASPLGSNYHAEFGESAKLNESDPSSWKYRTDPRGQLLKHVENNWLKFDHLQTWANNIQHVATRRNRAAKRAQHVAPNNVAMCCVDMLRSFGRGLRINNISTRCFRNRRYLFRYLAQSQY